MLFRDNLISKKQKQSVHNISGHSSDTARVEYIMAERDQDVRNSRDMFRNSICKTICAVNDFDSIDAEDTYSDDDDVSINVGPTSPQRVSSQPETAKGTAVPSMKWAEWGRGHPDIGKADPARVKWSDMEKLFIGKWCASMQKTHPHCRTMMAECRSAILADPVAREIFHPHHLIRPDRLRAGYQSYLRKCKK